MALYNEALCNDPMVEDVTHILSVIRHEQVYICSFAALSPVPAVTVVDTSGVSSTYKLERDHFSIHCNIFPERGALVGAILDGLELTL